MSKIKGEIDQAMTGLTKDGDTFTSHFVFPPEFLGFQGHFPAKKVLPGACQIQCALATLERVHDKTVGLKAVLLAKYFTPVFPNEEIICSIGTIADEEADSVCKALISKNGEKVAELKLRVHLKGAKKKQRIV